jgi:hypothetical protein
MQRALLDHFIGSGEQGCWYLKADRLRGLKVDYEFEASSIS